MKGTTKRSFASSRPALPSPTKGGPMRKLTKEQKRDIRVIAAKRFLGHSRGCRLERSRNRQVLSTNEEARYDASGFRRNRMAQSRWPRLPDQSEWAAATRHASLHERKESEQA